MRKEVPKKETLLIGPQGQDLTSFLNTLKAKEERVFRAVEKPLRRLVSSASGIEIRSDPEGFLHLSLVEDGHRAPARFVSEGTLRVLGIISIFTALRQATLIGYEEPENRVHPHRMKEIAHLLQNSALDGDEPSRQLIITTHSPILPLYFDWERKGAFTQILVAQKENDRTVLTPFEEFGDHRPLYRGLGLERALQEMERVGLD
jgi:predicted ATPase